MSAISLWHRFVDTQDAGVLDQIIDANAVFYSPVVHSPQQGEAIVKKYLTTAMGLLTRFDFTYTHEIENDAMAVLEFEVTIDGIYINGVDIIHFNAAGRITEFKVMVRPLQGMLLLKEKMAASLSA